MAKRDRTRETLERLAAAVEADPHGSAAAVALRKALRSRVNLVVAAAMAHIGEHGLAGFEDEVAAAFFAALHDPLRRDPGCRSKAAAVELLDRLEQPTDELFLTGARHVQLEPIWGGRRDTASELRSRSLLALVHRHHPRAMLEAGRALADPEHPVRRAAAEALARSGDALTAVPVLSLKLRIGDEDPEVLAACCAALLELDPDTQFAVVSEQLESPDDGRAEAAALALGQQRPAGALAVLRSFAEAQVGARAEVAMLALAMLRDDEAWSYLLGQLRGEPPARAQVALRALAIYRDHGDLRERVYAAVAERETDDGLEDAVVEAFG